MSRKALPTEMHKLHGNPSKLNLNERGESEPKPTKVFELPEPPDHLGAYGKKEWHRVGPVLIKSGLLTEADMMTFEAYCLNVDLLVSARKEIADKGMLISGGRDGRGKVRNPAIAAFSAATTAIRSLAAEFGMTPSARSRIKLPTDDDGVLKNLLGDEGGYDDFTEGV